LSDGQQLRGGSSPLQILDPFQACQNIDHTLEASIYRVCVTSYTCCRSTIPGTCCSIHTTISDQQSLRAAISSKGVTFIRPCLLRRLVKVDRSSMRRIHPPDTVILDDLHRHSLAGTPTLRFASNVMRHSTGETPPQ
jgi:hypothetical protein